MNITIFGGTGEAGVMTIKKALEKGFSVTAFARTPSKIPVIHHNLIIHQGELTELDKVERAIQGADAVISLLGPTGKSKGLAISNGIKNIITAMEKQGVKRLIATATPSYKDPNDKFQLGFAFGVFMVKSFIKDTYADIVQTGTYVAAANNLDWTLVRLPMLSSKEATGKLNVGYTGTGSVSLFSLTREDLADFLLQQIVDKTYIKKAPVISN